MMRPLTLLKHPANARDLFQAVRDLRQGCFIRLKNYYLMIGFRDRAWSDYLYWQQTDKTILRRINQLIRDIQRNPFDGIGTPEPLPYRLAGLWSRRIEEEHRLVYAVQEENIVIAQCRYHYTN